jgi:intein/homing endonuclease
LQGYTLSPTEAAYFAGLFDGEGNVNVAQYWKLNKKMGKKYLCWRIAMEIAMTDKEQLNGVAIHLVVI